MTLDPVLWAEAGAEQEKRRSQDTWEIILADIPVVVTADGYFNGPTTTVVHVVGDQERVATKMLLERVLRIPNAAQMKPADTMRLANVMRALGWEKKENKITINGKQVHGFFRKKLSVDQPTSAPDQPTSTTDQPTSDERQA